MRLKGWLCSSKKMSKYHDQRVKLRRFNPRDMVLQKVSQATKDLT